VVLGMVLRPACSRWQVPLSLIGASCAPQHSQPARGAAAVAGGQQALPFITINVCATRLAHGKACWRA